MSWICSRCRLTLINLVRVCPFCANERSEFEPFDSIDEIISAERLRKLNATLQKGSEAVTSQEELFSKLFNHEKILVKDMDILTLRAHREELATIAFEARARLTAVDDEEKGRQKTKQSEGPKGFERNLNTDETTTNAINTIKKRGEKINKMDKIREGLIKMGMDPDEADKIMRARNISNQVNRVTVTSKEESDSLKVQQPQADNSSEGAKPVFNPFAK